jgi:hypothetical protein
MTVSLLTEISSNAHSAAGRGVGTSVCSTGVSVGALVATVGTAEQATARATMSPAMTKVSFSLMFLPAFQPVSLWFIDLFRIC